MIYLDHAATSYPTKYFAKDYYIPGNPNSPHAMGLQANRALNEARNRIKKCLGVNSGKVLFCQSATKAVDWLTVHFSIFQAVSCYKGEHDSVWDCCWIMDILEDKKNIDQYDENDLYIHQYINQVTGSIFDIETISKQIQSTGIFFVSDFTAAIGHHQIPKNLDSFCDSVWFSGHKFGCELGIGAIWLSDRLFKYIDDGKFDDENSYNEYGLLRGTPNVSAAVAMSYAMENAIGHVEDNNKRYLKLASHLFDKLINEHNITAALVGQDQPKTHAINAVYLPGFNADALVQYLSSKGIYISPGYSACATHSEDASRVLEAFGLTKEQASQTVRISFGEDTSMEDIDALVNGIVEFKKLFI